MANLTSYIFVLLTVLMGVYGQLILKYRMSQAGSLPDGLLDKGLFLLERFMDPWVLSAFVSAFLGAICWMAAMTKLPLSNAYPFTSLTFVLILFFSAVFFHEPISLYKLLGLVLIIGGIIMSNLN